MIRRVELDLDDFIRQWDAICKQIEEENNRSVFVHSPNRPIRTSKTFKPIGIPKIKNVLFNDPATIVIFEDGSKTISKVEKGDHYDKETGLAICIAKRVLGNAEYRKAVNKYVYAQEDTESQDCSNCEHFSSCKSKEFA